MSDGMEKKSRGRPTTGRTERLSTKISPELFAAIEREVENTGKSKAQLVGEILEEAFKSPDDDMKARAFGKPHVKAAALLFAKLSTAIEAQTGEGWREDRYTFEAIRHGLIGLLAQMAPIGEIKVPSRLSSRAEAMGAGFADYWDKPENLGTASALGLWDQMMLSAPPPIDHPANEKFTDGFYQFSKIRSDLDLNGDENE